MSAIRLGMSLMNSSPADAGIHTPEKGRTEREQLLDAARAPVQKKLGRDDVRFEVEQIRAGDDWAFVYVRMLNANGSVLDYGGTPLADSANHGYASPDYVALLQQADGRSDEQPHERHTLMRNSSDSVLLTKKQDHRYTRR